MIECICIDAKNKPKEIPKDKWLIEGNKYHITYIYNMIKQGIMGCTIAEKSIDDLLPYNCYSLKRFAFTEEGIKAVIKMASTCAEFNDFDLTEFERIAERELAILN